MFGISRKELGTDEIIQNQMTFYTHADQQFAQINGSLEALRSKLALLERKVDYLLGIMNVVNETVDITKNLQKELEVKLEHTVNLLTTEVAEVELEGLKRELKTVKKTPKEAQEEGIEKHSRRTLAVVERESMLTESINKVTERLGKIIKREQAQKRDEAEAAEGVEL